MRLMTTSIPEKMTVCDSRVLVLGRGRHMLYVFVVSAKHTLRDTGNVTLQIVFNGVAYTRLDNDTLVASTYWTKASFVSLQRLASLPLRLEPLASVNFTAPYPRFCSAEICCLSLTGTEPPACTPSCRFARRATRPLNGEFFSTLRSVLMWVTGFSSATNSFLWISIRRTCLSTPSHEQLVRERHRRIEGHY